MEGADAWTRSGTPRRRLGSSDLDVFPLALGANTFGWTATSADSKKILDAYCARGGNLIDTADSYSAWADGNRGGESEEIVGAWLADRGRDEVIIATKVSQHPEFPGLSGANVAAAAEASLARLRTDYVDVYFAHYDDHDTPLEETVSAFDQLVRRGLVRHVGVSNYSAERVAEWLDTAARLGAAPPVVVQPHYNLLVRKSFEGEMRPVASAAGLGVTPYFGLAAGFLTGKYRSAGDAAGAVRQGMVADYLTPAGFAVVDELVAVARELHSTPTAVALAWLRSQPTVTSPIASASTPSQVTELLDSAALDLDADHVARLSRAADVFEADRAGAG